MLLPGLLTILRIISVRAFKDSEHKQPATETRQKREDIANCGDNCATCDTDQDVCDLCVLGWYGKTCSQRCLNCDPGGCSRYEGMCYQCETGYWGERCNFRCSEKCRAHNNKRPCNRESGSCLEGCISGVFGSRCDEKCSSKCSTKTCSFMNGECIGGCKSGWYGDHCNKKCNPACIHNECDSAGYCKHGCKVGYYGHRCSSHCSKNCINSTCKMNLNLGIPDCSHGCVDGWMDVDCEQKCPTNCISCDRYISGVCSQCRHGWSGSGCNKSCNGNCVKSMCDNKGRCIKGCIPGWRGEQCNTTCQRNCNVCDRYTGTCLSILSEPYGIAQCLNCQNSLCDRQGRCTDGCSGGFYGEFCEKSCDPKCKICDQRTGSCETCQPGLYGQLCDIACSEHCANKICGTYGHCTEGCVAGFYSPTCNLVCPNNCIKCDRNGICLVQSLTGDEVLKEKLVVGLPVGAAIIAIVLALAVVAFFYRRYLRRKGGPLCDEEGTDALLLKIVEHETPAKPSHKHQDANIHPDNDDIKNTIPPPPREEEVIIKQSKKEIEDGIHGKVRTTVVGKILCKFEEGKHCVTVTGLPGAGKTTAAYLVLNEKEREGYQTLICKSPEETFSALRHNERVVIMLNDVFGSPDFSPSLMKKWEPVLKMLLPHTLESIETTEIGYGEISQKQCFVLLVITTYNRTDAMLTDDKFANTLFSNDLMVDCDNSPLSFHDKSEILKKHLQSQIEKKKGNDG